MCSCCWRRRPLCTCLLPPLGVVRVTCDVDIALDWFLVLAAGSAAFIAPLPSGVSWVVGIFGESPASSWHEPAGPRGGSGCCQQRPHSPGAAARSLLTVAFLHLLLSSMAWAMWGPGFFHLAAVYLRSAS